VAHKVSDADLVTSDVGLTTGTVLLIAVTVAATWFAAQKLRTLTLAGEE
jgi:ABC-2 type transport system permease protein